MKMEIDSLLFVLMQFILRENCYAWSQMELIYLHHSLSRIENTVKEPFRNAFSFLHTGVIWNVNRIK